MMLVMKLGDKKEKNMDSYIALDKNNLVNSTIDEYEVEWHDARKAPFSLHGFFNPQNEPFFRRLPADVAKNTSVAVDKLSRESTGGRVRFSTDSPYIAIRAKYLVVSRASHLTLVSTAGFDLYIDSEFGGRYVREFRMPNTMDKSYEQIIHLDCGKMRSFTINFPVHSVVESLEIGLAPSATVKEAAPYRDIKPVVIYGSSIVHGTAASRPGLIYPAIMSRDLNIDFLNLGFSGNAKGEPVLAEYLSELPMSIFVCDYDHNAPTLEHLEQTHHRFYEIIREKNPDVPYIMVTRPNYYSALRLYDEVLRRRDVIMRSYLKAREKGDRNVYFIDGMSFMTAPHQYDTMFDQLHPGDVGFVKMADGIGTVIRHIIEKGL